MLTRSLKTGFVMIAVILMSSLWIACGGGGGGGGNSGGVSADSLVGKWKVSKISVNGETLICPGIVGAHDCSSADIFEYKSNGTQIMTWPVTNAAWRVSSCYEIEGTWSLSGSTLTSTEIKGGSCGASKQTYAEPQVWEETIAISGNTLTRSYTEDGASVTFTHTRQ